MHSLLQLLNHINVLYVPLFLQPVSQYQQICQVSGRTPRNHHLRFQATFRVFRFSQSENITTHVPFSSRPTHIFFNVIVI